MRSGALLGAGEVLRDLPAEDIGDKRRLARAAHARDRDKCAERDGDVDVLQVVGLGAADDEILAVALAPLPGDRDHTVAAQVRGRDRVRVAEDLVHGTGRHDLSPMLARSGDRKSTRLNSSHMSISYA